MDEWLSLILGLFFNVILIVVLLNIKKMNIQKVKFAILSSIATVIVAIIPIIGYRVDNNNVFTLGFPADAFYYEGDWMFSIASFGLVFNFFFFYWIFKLINKAWRFSISTIKRVC
ncbi:hypothetical protein CEQ21_00380 [Niallia circulans]|uniref:Uncharacterized protein n=1 Tax=Niallia circulans TaxID=1397 RepID=A0A553SR46_NIACI|nr:hypothetical protein [Niallia circulans]TRZ39469.1 hypothetical protein CEQ21_00380 [Niallia circulans]